MGKADSSWAMIHGTNLIGAKYALAEALVRLADWTYCEQPTRANSLHTDATPWAPRSPAGGNDLVQIKCASHGVVTLAEKYTVARSEHCTIKSVIVAWDDLTFIRNRINQSHPYDSTDPKDGSKDDKDDRPPDPDIRRLRSWDGADYGDEDDA
eukprot:s357_g28.t1